MPSVWIADSLPGRLRTKLVSNTANFRVSSRGSKSRNTAVCHCFSCSDSLAMPFEAEIAGKVRLISSTFFCHRLIFSRLFGLMSFNSNAVGFRRPNALCNASSSDNSGILCTVDFSLLTAQSKACRCASADSRAKPNSTFGKYSVNCLKSSSLLSGLIISAQPSGLNGLFQVFLMSSAKSDA